MTGRPIPPRVDTGTTIETGAGWQAGDAGGPFTFDRAKPQINWTSTYFLPEKAGSHDFKFGYEYANDQSKFAQQRRLRADPVSRSQRRDQRDPGHRPGHV